jgi:hypothetical protein
MLVLRPRALMMLAVRDLKALTDEWVETIFPWDEENCRRRAFRYQNCCH